MAIQQLNSVLELRWLKPPKHVPLPDVCIVEDIDYNGLYYRPNNKRYLLGGRVHLNNKGTIVVASLDPQILAHEFRHHLQYLGGMKQDFIDGVVRRKTLESIGVVNLSLETHCDFYKNSATEWDALMYQHIKSPSDYCDITLPLVEKRRAHLIHTRILEYKLGKFSFSDVIKRPT
jgi:hypothetical protein